MIGDVPKASLRDWKLWEVPAGMEMPLEVVFSRWGILSLDIWISSTKEDGESAWRR